MARERYLRISDIVGDTKKGKKPLIPIGRSTWYRGVQEGRFPQPIRLASRTVVWRESDVCALMGDNIHDQE